MAAEGKAKRAKLSFAFKTKAPRNVAEEFKAQDEDDSDAEEIDLAVQLSKGQAIALEDAATKINRLKSEGVVLAEAEKYRQAIARWQEAVNLKPTGRTAAGLWEMIAQAHLCDNDSFAAIQSAEKAVAMSEDWYQGHWTLARAQLQFGEITMAVERFRRARTLAPPKTAQLQSELEDALQTQQKLVAAGIDVTMRVPVQSRIDNSSR
eukprot:TRINITY_DN7544_c0_g1_i1.p1 TRINITY_DN7544_c0_g1~~TRINITY_DN7544_c0_g1_i1.p1  ORF type:complete len:207 (+),score=35.14 TRINITY_DN7544_c0_g1_i1:91-711(+)